MNLRKKAYETPEELLELCSAVTAVLARFPLLSPMLVRQSLSEVDSGWLCSLARLPHDVTFTISLDRTAGFETRDIWCGFCARTETRANELADAAARFVGHSATRDNEQRQLHAHEFGRLFVEHLKVNEHYVGVYLRGNVLSVEWIVAFCTGVVALLEGSPGPTRTDIPGLDAGLPLTPRVLTEIAARRGQQTFRRGLLAHYGPICCVTGALPDFLLEAAHIRTAHGNDINVLQNGVLLRPDLHTLFDLGQLAFDPVSRCALLSPQVRELSVYAGLHWAPPRFRQGAEDVRDTVALRERLEVLTWKP